MYSNMDTTTNDQTKSEGERQIWYHYMWNLKYDTVEPIYETETESEA